MTKLLGFILVVVAAIGCANWMPEPKEPTIQERICEHTQWEGCLEVEPPIVVRSLVVSPLFYGFYFPGEPYIFVNMHLTPEREYETTLHETVHYLGWELDILTEKCQSEQAARTITSEILGTKYDSTWYKRYKCPAPELTV